MKRIYGFIENPSEGLILSGTLFYVSFFFMFSYLFFLQDMDLNVIVSSWEVFRSLRGKIFFQFDEDEHHMKVYVSLPKYPLLPLPFKLYSNWVLYVVVDPPPVHLVRPMSTEPLQPYDRVKQYNVRVAKAFPINELNPWMWYKLRRVKAIDSLFLEFRDTGLRAVMEQIQKIDFRQRLLYLNTESPFVKYEKMYLDNWNKSQVEFMAREEKRRERKWKSLKSKEGTDAVEEDILEPSRQQIRQDTLTPEALEIQKSRASLDEKPLYKNKMKRRRHREEPTREYEKFLHLWYTEDEEEKKK
eukprot:TRINITY_DN1841_c0_g1_i17.p1 TRINITY_DN1841_c0_g1~~TRINITY_DN1841_c0_g1_i17.p1  ORF type:complete len:300 (+),score=43.29 TRINITY_DN1841_c0_g1_i17:974-1873(+)